MENKVITEENKVITEIGDYLQGDFYPQLKCHKWENEINLSMRLIWPIENSSVYTIGNIRYFETDKLNAKFYPTDNGYEFEIILKKPIPTTYLDFSLETKGIDIFYQGDLTLADIQNGAERPYNVVGSYAVYAGKGKSNNIYGTGKLCHIYAPIAVDSKGNTEKLYLEKIGNSFRLHIPKALTDLGNYPIMIDPTFGYETLGGSVLRIDKRIWMIKYTTPADADIQIQSMHAGLYTEDGVTAKYKFGIINDGITAVVGETTVGSTNAVSPASWHQLNFSSPVSVDSETIYWWATWGEEVGGQVFRLAFDSFTQNNKYQIEDFVDSNSWPLAGYTNYSDKRLSLYMTYTSGGDVDVYPNEALHSHIADNASISQNHVIAVEEALHSHSADNAIITQNHVVVVAEALHSHSADNAIITQNHVIAVAEALHNHTADNATVETEYILSIAEALHNHTADNAVISQNHVIAIEEALHSHTADNATVETEYILSIAEALHSHTADNVTIETGHVIAVAEALHNHTADNTSITQNHVATIAEALHNHTADNVTIETGHVIAVAEALHNHSADNTSITQNHVATIAEALHNHTADNAVIAQNHVISIIEALHNHTADNAVIVTGYIIAVAEALHSHTADNATVDHHITGILSNIKPKPLNYNIKPKPLNYNIKPKPLNYTLEVTN